MEIYSKGEELAGKYIKDDINLTTELSKYGDQERKYVVPGNFFDTCPEYRPVRRMMP